MSSRWQFADPSGHTCFGGSRDSSGIEASEAGVDFYEPKDVPQSEVGLRRYLSKVTGQFRRCCACTPPDYDTNLHARHPALYRQHGSGQGHTCLILDNLVAAGNAGPITCWRTWSR